ENNTVSGNQYGVVYNSVGGDLGNAAPYTTTPAGSVGNNTLSCNSNADLYCDTSSIAISANQNKWDHSPVDSSATPTLKGQDVFTSNCTVSFNTGNSVSPTPCPACAGTAASSQVFNDTMIGCGGTVPLDSRATLC